MNWFISILAITSSLFCFGEIKELASMQDILPYIQKDTLIIFDIDDTLFTSKQELGSDRWLCNYIRELEASGKSKNESLDTALNLWFALQCKTDVRPMEEQTPALINKLQQKRHMVMCLTTRSLEVYKPTVRQLSSCSIDMRQSQPYPYSFRIRSMPLVFYYKGILFTSACHKGKALMAFLQEIHYVPSHVIFINDKSSHIQEVEEELAKANIPFLGFRYSKSDALVAGYKAKIAAIQLEYFGKILDDDAAEAILLSREKH